MATTWWVVDRMWLVFIALLVTGAHAFSNALPRTRPPVLPAVSRPYPPIMAEAVDRADAEAEVPLLQLLQEKQLRAVLKRAAEEPRLMLEFLQDAGAAGVVAYFIAFVAFVRR